MNGKPMKTERSGEPLIIQTRGLTKQYNHVKVVDNAALAVSEGEVYGFLGPNGAGKTTLIRMLLGLIRPDAGEIEIFGEPMPQARIKVLQRVGALVERPAYYEHLTAWENLKIFALLHGIKDNHPIKQALERVGLSNNPKEVKAYSLGMKQRLGIALAMVHKPKLLLLDEPTNGLDPEGIQEVRELIRGLPQEGVTVLVSSHLLGEVEQVASKIGIIYEGCLLFQGAKQELVSQGGECTFQIYTEQLHDAFRCLETQPLQLQLERGGEQVLHVKGSTSKANLKQLLHDNRIKYNRITGPAANLEEAYLDLVRSSKGQV